MRALELWKYIETQYGVPSEQPWPDHPGYRVLRHPGNKKWFAVTMDIPGEKLGLEGTVEIVNLKCDPILIGSLLSEPGYFPAWHMNKNHWIGSLLVRKHSPQKGRFFPSPRYFSLKGASISAEKCLDPKKTVSFFG